MPAHSKSGGREPPEETLARRMRLQRDLAAERADIARRLDAKYPAGSHRKRPKGILTRLDFVIWLLNYLERRR